MITKRGEGGERAPLPHGPQQSPVERCEDDREDHPPEHRPEERPEDPGEGERYRDEQNQERFVFEGGRFRRAWGRHGVRSHGAITSAVVAARAMLRSIPANTI